MPSPFTRAIALTFGGLVAAGVLSVAVPAAASTESYTREGTYTVKSACESRAATLEERYGASAYCQWDENNPPTWGLYVQW